MDHKKIVVIEKDKILLSILELFAEQLGHEIVASFLSFKDSIDFIKKNEVHTLIIDLNSFENRVNNIQDIEFIKSFNFPILFIGNSNDIEFAKKMIRFNIYSFMSKPITKNILKINIDIACSKHKLISNSENEQSLSESPIFCTVNKAGEVQLHDTVFYNYFNFQLEDIEGVPLCVLFSHNQEFKDFAKTTKGLIPGNSIKSLFLHENKVYESLIYMTTDDYYKVFIKNSPLEASQFYNNQDLSARFSTIFENSTEAIQIYNVQNRLVNFNGTALKQHQKIFNKDLMLDSLILDNLNFISHHEFESLLDTIRIPAVHKLNRTIVQHGREYAFQFRISPIYSEEIGTIGGYIVSNVEISQENKLKKEIEVLKNELKPIYESSIQRFYLTNKNKIIVAFNEAALKTVQKEFNHTLQKGDSILKFVPSVIGEERFLKVFEDALQGQPYNSKFKTEGPNETVWTEIHMEPVISESGDLNRVLVWTLDITDIQNNLIALDKSNERYEIIAKGGNDGLWDWNLETNEVYFSPRWKNLLGYKDDEIENIFGVRQALTHPEDKIKSEEKLTQYVESKNNLFENEIRLLCKDQSYKWVLERGIILRNNDGKAYRLAGSITDITSHKQSEETLLELNRSLLEERAMFIKGNVGIIRVDANDINNVTYVSENIFLILGYSTNDFYSNQVPFNDIVHPEDIQQHKKERDLAIKNNKAFIDFTDYRMIKKDKTIIWVRDFTTIIRNEDGISLLGYLIDVTNEKVVEFEYDNLQNIFSAIWQSLIFETFIVQKNGKILFSKNQTKYNTQKLLDHDFFIFDELSCLEDWGRIENKIQNNEYEFNTIQAVNNKKYEIKVSKIDQEKILISTNIAILS